MIFNLFWEGINVNFLSACCADNHNPSCLCSWAEEESVLDEGPNAGGSRDVQDCQQGHQAREGPYSWLHGWVQVNMNMST